MLDLAARALTLLAPETAHRTTIRLLRWGTPFLAQAKDDDPRLRIETLGQTFPNPIGLAAGFDKDAKVPKAILKLGFGFAECGSITPRPQAGNPSPRLFRLTQDRAVINRMGFNNAGMDEAMRALMSRHGGIVGINIGANKDSTDRIADYVACFQCLARFGDYVAVNVSSPNTPGLRGLQNRHELELLLNALIDARGRANMTTPLLLKIAPDIDAAAMDDIAEVSLAAGIEGLIVSNTTIARPVSLKSAHKSEAGGLSGAPLFAPSNAILKSMYARVGSKQVLIGVGGIASGADAYAKIRAGASLVQLYTALVYEGPGLVSRIKSELLTLLARDGFVRLTQAVGADHR